MALDPQDVVYTPDWVARDMVEYFKPSGRILEPLSSMDMEEEIFCRKSMLSIILTSWIL
jgi:hypothetical protein